jgi:hypothetical protein
MVPRASTADEKLRFGLGECQGALGLTGGTARSGDVGHLVELPEVGATYSVFMANHRLV